MDSSAKETNMADAKIDHNIDTEYLEDDLHKDLRTNLSGEIRNPLSGLSQAELSSQVVTFCNKYDFNDSIDLFQKAALVAQKQQDFESIPVLTEDDKYHLRRETTHKWHLPFDMYMCVAVVSIGSALQ